MKALVTGASGMLGRAVVERFLARGYDVVGLSREALDVTRGADVRLAFDRHRPDVVIQCAAYTDVDRAESDVAGAFALNADATETVVRECQRMGVRFVYPSTDYVFSGENQSAWTPADLPSPLNAYGRSKLAGERAALDWADSLVVRTSWLYGRGGRNFVDRISELGAERDELEVVDDQFGRPTWTDSLADVIADLLDAGARGTFHASGSGDPVSWFDLAREVVHRQGLDTRIRPVSSAAFPRPAKRPRNSVLECGETERTIGRKLASWTVMLDGYLPHRAVAGVRR